MSTCHYHPEVETAGFCRQCGKGLCADCKRDVQGMFYCEECLAAYLSGGAPRPAASAGIDANPVLAGVLGFIPGVGAIYNGEYMKAIVYILIFGGAIAVMDRGLPYGFEPLLGLFIAGFVFYMALDSYRVAKARGAGLGPAPQAGWDMPDWGEGKGAPLGPIILIAIGGLFLVQNFMPFHFHIIQFWPLALIGLGAYMIWQRTGAGPR